MRRSITRIVSPVAAVVVAALAFTGLETAAQASASPTVTSLSVHAGPYWGGRSVTVHGTNFSSVRDVLFGSTSAWGVRVVSPTTITVTSPYRDYSTVHVFVRTSAGTSRKTEAATFTFRKPKMNEPIQGGMTGDQEQSLSASVRSKHRSPALAARSSHWTASMGLTAARRATSWLGLPYSWAGGNASGPSYGVCAHNGGDLDCHIVGFDCSGLSLYSWSPYKTVAHYAASQRTTAGRFHPAVGELMPGDLVFFSAYIPNGVGHVAVYEGNGMVIEAPESGYAVRRSRLVDLIASDGEYRGATRPLSTGRQGALPSVSYVTSTASTTGSAIKILGNNLGASTTSVTIGGQTIYHFLKRTTGSVVVQAPAHKAGSVSVSVSNAWGTVTRSITYVAPPVFSTLSPSTGSTVGGTTVTMAGSGIPTVSSVILNGTALPFRRTGTATRHTLTVTMPAHAPGRYKLTLVSRYGKSAARYFTYVAPTSAPTTPAPSTSSSSAGSARPKTRTAPATSSPSSTSPSTPTPSSSAASPSGTPTS